MSGGGSSGSGSHLCYREVEDQQVTIIIIIMDLLTITSKEFHLTNC